MRTLAVIGGSGIYDIEDLVVEKEIAVDTPFGKPSGNIVAGKLNNRHIFFLPRHGRHHTISPSEINYRANIYALKSLGVNTVLSLCACGSLKEKYKPLDFVIPDQFVDRTNQARKCTFFENGAVAHVSMAKPVCDCLTKTLLRAVEKSGVSLHGGGTYLNMEGPQFSTLAESNLYRSWGMDIIGMTAMNEARLAREAQMCFVVLAAVTDYDCWHPEHGSVSVEAVIKVLRENSHNSKKIIKEFICAVEEERNCSCSEALKHALLTGVQHIPEATKKKIEVILGDQIR